MKESLVRLAIRSGLHFLSFLVLLGRGAYVCIRTLGHQLGRLFYKTAPVLTFFYFVVRKLKAKTFQFLKPLRGHTLYLFGHRYFIHALVILIVFIAATPSLRAADEFPTTFGEQLLLKELVTSDEEEETVIDDTMPSAELESYLEGIFQDQPLPRPEVELPLTLQGEALLRPEVPGTLVPPTRTEIVEYQVESGDTIWGLAEKFGISVPTVLWENKLTLWSIIRPGLKLTILPTSGVAHLIHKGETLERIAKQYSTSVEEIKQYNLLAASGTLPPGLKLTIPGGRPYAEATPARERRREVVKAPTLASTPLGKMLWPVISRRITQYFKWRHAGLDIGDTGGSPIYAVEAGVVELAGWGRGGWGNMVLLDHGQGLKTRYAHASKVLVSAGQAVAKGETIALVGSTGRSTGPHLHFGVYVNGRTVNPLQYLR